MSIAFENIHYLKDTRLPGKLKFVDTGFGFKADSSGSVHTIKKEEIDQLSFSRGILNYQLRIYKTDGELLLYENFRKADLDSLRTFFNENYGLTIAYKELCIKGKNWGMFSVEKHALCFTCEDRPVFEIPFAAIQNVSISGKDELSVELRGKGLDYPCELRLYVPEEENENAHTLCDSIRNEIEHDDSDKKHFASLGELRFLVPRGRFEVDCYSSLLKLRGKTFDHTVNYSQLNQLFVLKNPEDDTTFVVLSLNSPLKQGQTQYGYVVLGFNEDDQSCAEIHDTEVCKAELTEQTSAVDACVSVISSLVGHEPIRSDGCISPRCLHKTNDGYLYFLDKNLLFAPKAVLIPLSTVAAVEFGRISGAGIKFFEMSIRTKGNSLYPFTGIAKEHLQLIQAYFSSREIQCKMEGPSGGMQIMVEEDSGSTYDGSDASTESTVESVESNDE